MGDIEASAALPGPQRAAGTAVLFDTFSLVFRAYHALPPMNTSAGAPTSALYGFSALLLKILKERTPAALAFALDSPKRTFRRERYPAYKAQRETVPSPLGVQLGRLQQLLSSLQVPVVCAPGFEADDVLATLARGLRDRWSGILIVTGDRDLLQLVDERTRVLFVGARAQKPTLFDVAQVEERFEVAPEQLPSWAALVGDTSDNLPGVPGIGPRTAAKLVRQFGSISELLQRLSEVQPERVRDALRCHAEQLGLNEELARLRCDVPLTPGPLAGALTESGRETLRAAFVELEFKSLVPRLDALTIQTS